MPTPTPMPSALPQQITNRADIELVRIAPGSFMMGSMNGEANDQPEHQVMLGKVFYIGKYEVTQAQWQKVMGENPSHFSGDSLPVERVSWDDAVAFIARLNARNAAYTYRLPSEAEWEYAARAGTTGEYAGVPNTIAWYGNNSGRGWLEAQLLFNADSSHYDQRIEDNGGQTHPVGQKQANAFGLYDMYGNVWEWCADVWHDNYHGAPTDGSAWLSGGEPTHRVLRGGSWNTGDAHLRSTPRVGKETSLRASSIGFRVVADVR